MQIAKGDMHEGGGEEKSWVKGRSHLGEPSTLDDYQRLHLAILLKHLLDVLYRDSTLRGVVIIAEAVNCEGEGEEPLRSLVPARLITGFHDRWWMMRTSECTRGTTKARHA